VLQPAAESAGEPTKPGQGAAPDGSATSPARPQTPSSSPDAFSKASPLPSPTLEQPTAAQTRGPRGQHTHYKATFL